jgi:phosphoglycerol transferase MdoB-like AlkP superfamily enzyme
VKYLPLRDRVEAAFAEQTARSFGHSYLEALLVGWREIAQSLRRSLALVVVLMVAFFLLKNSKTSDFTLGPIKLTNISSVLTVLPVLVSVLIYECMGLVSAFSMYREMTGEVVRSLHPSIYENDLEMMLAPPTITLIGGVGENWEGIRKSPPGLPGSILGATTVAIFAAIVGASFGFLTYAYGYLYTDTHVNSLVVSLSLGASVLYAVRALALAKHTEDQY